MDTTVDPTAALPKTRHRESRRLIQQRHTRAHLQLLHGDVESWRWWPFAMRRIAHFADRYSCDMNMPAFIQLLTSYLVTGTDLYRLWVAVAGDQLVGHVIATIERQANGVTKAFIWQLELDTPLPARQRHLVFRDLCQWGQAQGAQCLEMWTAHDPVLWTRSYGLVPYRTIMRRTL
jgi:hypothetical protein